MLLGLLLLLLLLPLQRGPCKLLQLVALQLLHFQRGQRELLPMALPLLPLQRGHCPVLLLLVMLLLVLPLVALHRNQRSYR